MAPDTIVAAVAANTTWKNQFIVSPLARKKSLVPIKPPADSPYIRPQPIAQYRMAPAEKSIRFFMMMFPAFLARVRPVSTMANPACIKNTSPPQRSSQMASKAAE